ncbi:MAG: hypothetical protein U0984_06725, partial [Prosthecobacter sp.]|nr:hypothetical protein [Prosthecobacter sp.]
DITDPANMDPTQMTPAKIENFLQQKKGVDDQVLAQAAAVLSPGQIKTLAAFQEQARNMARTGMQMSSMMINGGGPGK